MVGSQSPSSLIAALRNAQSSPLVGPSGPEALSYPWMLVSSSPLVLPERAAVLDVVNSAPTPVPPVLAPPLPPFPPWPPVRSRPPLRPGPRREQIRLRANPSSEVVVSPLDAPGIEDVPDIEDAPGIEAAPASGIEIVEDFTVRPTEDLDSLNFERLISPARVAEEPASVAVEPQPAVDSLQFDLMDIVPVVQEQAAVEPELVMVEPTVDATALRIAEEPAQAAVEPQSAIVEPTYDAALMDILQMPPLPQAQADFGIPQEDSFVFEPELPQERVIDDFYIPRDPAIIEPRYELDPADLRLLENIFMPSTPQQKQEPVVQTINPIMLDDPVLLAILSGRLDATLDGNVGARVQAPESRPATARRPRSGR